MGLLDSILGAVGGKTDSAGTTTALVGVLSAILEQNGDLQGLANRFSQNGHGNTFSSWVGMGENQSISGNQIRNVLGSDQISALASRLGVDPAQVSQLLAEYLPKVVDKLTPGGQVDSNANHQEGLANLIPALLRSVTGDTPPA